MPAAPLPQTLLRREDARLLRGAGQFVGDLQPPGLLHAVFVRSAQAHGRVLAVQADAARASSASGSIGLTADGAVQAISAAFTFQLGHWLTYSALLPARNAARIVPGPYRVSSVSTQARSQMSHAAAVGIYRGAGRPEAAILLERLIDEAARQTGQDPLAPGLAGRRPACRTAQWRPAGRDGPARPAGQGRHAVCAQHGRELMGWKSPVGVPTWTQGEQGYPRADGKGETARDFRRKPACKRCEATHCKPHSQGRGMLLAMADDRWQMTDGSKAHRYAPCRPRRARGPAHRQAQTVHWTVSVRAQPTVNAALVHRQFAHLPGEICAPWRCGADGRYSWVVPYLRRPGARSRSPISSERTGPDPPDHTARPAVIHGVRPQKSAEAILVFQCFTRVAEHVGPNL